MSKQQILDDILPPHLELTFQRWQGRDDVRSRLPVPIYYRHRSEILKLIGVDISAGCFVFVRGFSA